ncbi:hypothetical protein [Mycoplasma suis]|uniref:Uncharacterized protein n=2 Tax=Mycoplasma suis TaxID=57372 RepID=F0QRF4_MYCSL|nr:hypothetical protein [Mycoplasma suis]ADX98074.1 hypothetical protein MSU_0541 [Mycoplasma suis str. Illinois]CBZ40572.1 hypothetical protein MSUIS_04790 [Mycoplasma suis KI3806]
MVLFSKIAAWIIGLTALGTTGTAISSFSGVKDYLNVFSKYLEENKENLKGKKIHLSESFSSIKELQEKINSVKEYLDGKTNSLDKLENQEFKKVIQDVKSWMDKEGNSDTKKKFGEASKKIDDLSNFLGKKFAETPDELKHEQLQDLLSKYMKKEEVGNLTPFILPIVSAINEADKELNRKHPSFEELNSSPEAKKFWETYKNL